MMQFFIVKCGEIFLKEINHVDLKFPFDTTV